MKDIKWYKRAIIWAIIIFGGAFISLCFYAVDFNPPEFKPEPYDKLSYVQAPQKNEWVDSVKMIQVNDSGRIIKEITIYLK